MPLQKKAPFARKPSHGKRYLSKTVTSFIVIGTSSQCVFYMLISTHLVLKTILVVEALLFVYDLVICCPHQLTPKYSRVMRSDFDSDHCKWLKKEETQTPRSGWYLQNCLRCRIKGLRCYWANIRFLKDLIIGCIKVQEIIRGGLATVWAQYGLIDYALTCRKFVKRRTMERDPHTPYRGRITPILVASLAA